MQSTNPPRPPFSGSIHRAIINNKRQASIFNRREAKQAEGSRKPWARTVRSDGGGGPGCMAKVTRPGLAGRASKHVKSWPGPPGAKRLGQCSQPN